VLLPGGQPVQLQCREKPAQSSGLPGGILHLRSPVTDRVDAERPEANALYSRDRIVQRIAPYLRHRREHAGLPENR